MNGRRTRLILAFDTSTRQTTVAVGEGRVVHAQRAADRDGGPTLLEQIDAALGAGGVTMDDLGGVAVGIGPGSFTGLRVALATAKTMAYARSLPLVGVPSAVALAHAAAAADGEAATHRRFVVIMAAGARDHYLTAVEFPKVLAPALPEPSRLLPPGTDLAAETLGALPVAIGLGPDAGRLGQEAARRGEAALQGLGASLLAIAGARMDAGDHDDITTLIPEYVALPRGVSDPLREMSWSPGLR